MDDARLGPKIPVNLFAKLLDLCILQDVHDGRLDALEVDVRVLALVDQLDDPESVVWAPNDPAYFTLL